MDEINQPIVKPTDVQSQRRFQDALRAQSCLEEFAHLVRAMRYHQIQRGFGVCGNGSSQILEIQVDTMVKSILERRGSSTCSS